MALIVNSSTLGLRQCWGVSVRTCPPWGPQEEARDVQLPDWTAVPVRCCPPHQKQAGQHSGGRPNSTPRGRAVACLVSLLSP